MSTQKIKEHRQFYMNGVWTDPVSDDSIDVLNPATEEVVARILSLIHISEPTRPY